MNLNRKRITAVVLSAAMAVTPVTPQMSAFADTVQTEQTVDIHQGTKDTVAVSSDAASAERTFSAKSARVGYDYSADISNKEDDISNAKDQADEDIVAAKQDLQNQIDQLNDQITSIQNDIKDQQQQTKDNIQTLKDTYSDQKDEDKKEYLIEHLKNTADLASYFASSFGWSIVAEQAGLLHDLGKMRQIIESFYSDFDQSINTEIPDRYDGDGKNTMNRYIYENESVNDQDKIYLCGIRHTHGMKSELNREIIQWNTFSRKIRVRNVCSKMQFGTFASKKIKNR